MFSVVVIVTLIGLFVKDATAITDELKDEVHAKFLKYGTECHVEHPLSADDINSFKEKKFPDGENAPRFMACVFKKLGFIDDKGSYSYDQVLEITEKKFSEEDQANFKEVLSNCDIVNEEEVSDGENGWERSKLAYNCLIERADIFDFDINI